MSGCAVAICKNNQKNKALRNFCMHKFPGDKGLQKQWIALCNRRDKVNPRTAAICSEHFTEDDYRRDLEHELLKLPPRRIRNLKKSAVPSKFLHHCEQVMKNMDERKNRLDNKRKTPIHINRWAEVTEENHQNIKEELVNCEDLSFGNTIRILPQQNNEIRTRTDSVSENDLDAENKIFIHKNREEESSEMIIANVKEEIVGPELQEPEEEIRDDLFTDLGCGEGRDDDIPTEDRTEINTDTSTDCEIIAETRNVDSVTAQSRKCTNSAKSTVIPVSILQPTKIKPDTKTKRVAVVQYHPPKVILIETISIIPDTVSNESSIEDPKSTGETSLINLLDSKTQNEAGGSKPEENSDKNFRECMQCGEIITDTSAIGFLLHLQEAHRNSVIDDFQCSYCLRHFMNQRAMDIHAAECTFKEKVVNDEGNELAIEERKIFFKCEICGILFPGDEELKKHTISHQIKCPVCEKVFYSAAKLKSHQAIHTDENLYECSFCGKTFIQKLSLRAHEALHTGQELFKCSSCEMTFVSLYQLETHARIHKGKKQHKCKICNKEFLWSYHLKDHEIVHTGEKPFQCSFCEKSFLRKSTLKCHQKTHAVQKPI